MSLFDQAIGELKGDILRELEQRIWERIEPRMQQELSARHMTISVTAEYLHVSEQTVRRMVRDREIPHFRVRNNILIRQLDVDEWIERQIMQTGVESCGENAG